MTKAGASLISSLLVMAVGCGVGDDDGGGGDPDPNPNRLKCTAAFTLSGTFTEGSPARPVGQGGCWPVGTWTFTATVNNTADVLDITGDGQGDRCGEVSGTTPPTVESSYSFQVNRVEDPSMDGLVESYNYLGSSPDFLRVHVSEGGAGDCEGTMEFVSQDAKQWWIFKPDQAGTTINGSGEYNLYLEPRPF
ncbi:MAG TPA: hypothetical protein VFQ53_02935 [Kofleriaceae bacterium]|nr:hypothetical protein [Kofleriaceae bacterium]